MATEEKNKLYFLIENTEIEIPEHFELFSVLVENYVNSFLTIFNLQIK